MFLDGAGVSVEQDVAILDCHQDRVCIREVGFNFRVRCLCRESRLSETAPSGHKCDVGRHQVTVSLERRQFGLSGERNGNLLVSGVTAQVF